MLQFSVSKTTHTYLLKIFLPNCQPGTVYKIPWSTLKKKDWVSTIPNKKPWFQSGNKSKCSRLCALSLCIFILITFKLPSVIYLSQLITCSFFSIKLQSASLLSWSLKSACIFTPSPQYNLYRLPHLPTQLSEHHIQFDSTVSFKICQSSLLGTFSYWNYETHKAYSMFY